MALISLIVAIYYNVIMAYTLIYFFSSMQTTLPWTVCQDVSTICFNVLYRARMDTLYNYLSIDHILLIV
jgi:solute carrier family 6 amino acid transporter-like protein 5/7/9/14